MGVPPPGREDLTGRVKLGTPSKMALGEMRKNAVDMSEP
jgi:hypothetical protein